MNSTDKPTVVRVAPAARFAWIEIAGARVDVVGLLGRLLVPTTVALPA